MRIHHFLSIVILFGCFLSKTNGQEPLRVSDTEATAHLLAHEDAVYPPIAKAAHVHGTVILEVTISGSGDVLKETVIDGPAMLQGAAIEAVKKWKYRAFEKANGQPVITYVSLPIGIEMNADQQKAAIDLAVGREYFALDDACRTALRTAGSGAVEPCTKEVAAAAKFPWQDQRHLEILDAHENLGRALLSNGKPEDAIKEFDIALLIAEKSMHQSDVEFAYVLVWRASAERQLGENEAALTDYTSGEESVRLAIKELPDMTKQYGFTLKRVLQQHAALLNAMGREQEAQKLVVEASSIETP